VIIPINIKKFHWAMRVIFPQKQEVKYYDSLGFSGKIYLNTLKRWLEQEAEEKEERGFDINEWKFEDVLKNGPHQQDPSTVVYLSI
jgi:Ulp1 family protease